jgi:hypothetical protein
VFAVRSLENAGYSGTRSMSETRPTPAQKVQRGNVDPGDSIAPATLMDFGGVLMTLRVKEPCCDEGGNRSAQNLLA